MLDAAVLAAPSSRGDCAAGSRGSVPPHHCTTALGLLQGMFLGLGFKPWETTVDLVDLYLLLGCTF